MNKPTHRLLAWSAILLLAAAPSGAVDRKTEAPAPIIAPTLPLAPKGVPSGASVAHAAEAPKTLQAGPAGDSQKISIAAPSAVPPAPASAEPQSTAAPEVTATAPIATPEAPEAGQRTPLSFARSLARALWPTARPQETVPGAAASAAVQTALEPARITAPITITTAEGIERPLSYDPSAPKAPFLSRVVSAVRGFPEQVRRVRAYKNRVDELMAAVRDEDLTWALSRLDTLKTQEGILRSNNAALTNQWRAGVDQKTVSYKDFAQSSLDWDSLAFLFKQSMDREEPTKQYQFTSAHNLHNHMPRVSHFMGTTLQERILQVALKGKPGQQAIWSAEEVRHGAVTERIYNLSRDPSHPPLTQQGIASKQPETGEYSARSMMSNRALAELGAGTAALAIKANALKDSPSDKMLHGWFQDEVYHYVMMSAGTYVAYGQKSRWHRLLQIVRHSFDYPMPAPADSVIHASRFPSLLTVAELGYALFAIDSRIDQYLRKAPEQTLKDWVGPVYPTDQDVADAIARGEHTWTEAARTEQNPELTMEEVQELVRRFPGQYSLDNRAIKRSALRQVTDTYRQRSLTSPAYWMRKKGFVKHGEGGELRRPLAGSEDAYLKIEFPAGAAPALSVWAGSADAAAAPAFRETLDRMSMLQIGAFMDAENLDVVKRLEETKAGMSDEDILKNLNRTPAYQKNPIKLIAD